MGIQFICDTCGNIGEKKFKSGIKIRNYCSKECGNSAKSRPGELNSRFGYKWTDEERKIQSNLIKSKVDDKYRLRCSKSNKGVKFSEERIRAMHSNRTSDSYRHYVSDDIKAVIGKKSSEKFEKPGFKEKFRKSMEESGAWIPLADLDEFVMYKRLCYWVKPMWNIINDLEQISLLNELKVFHPTKNSKGCVRDHLITKVDGFNMGVPPEILRHPANCRIITHSQNASKGSKSTISLDILFEKIYNYNNNWFEHELVLQLIQSYKDGFRWSKSNYIIQQKGGSRE